MIPDVHARFLAAALESLRRDPRLVGVAVGGSYLTHTMDEYSDLDLVVAVESGAYTSVLEGRQELAKTLAPLLRDAAQRRAEPDSAHGGGEGLMLGIGGIG
jgi:predicted nucleotidyltransferase